MSELWIKKSPTDVHRLIDNKLPEGSKCTGVAMTSLDEGMVEEYVATINGQEVIVQGPAEESADDVAAALVELAPPPPPPPPMAKATTDNAAMEGSEITEADEAMGGPVPDEYEYDDSSDENEGWEPDDAAPKAKKPKKKK